MSRGSVRQYCTPIGGPGLTPDAYSLPKDYGVAYFGSSPSDESPPPLTSSSTAQLPDRGVGISHVEPPRGEAMHGIESGDRSAK